MRDEAFLKKILRLLYTRQLICQNYLILAKKNKLSTISYRVCVSYAEEQSGAAYTRCYRM